jgi:hypothetical protein
MTVELARLAGAVAALALLVAGLAARSILGSINRLNRRICVQCVGLTGSGACPLCLPSLQIYGTAAIDVLGHNPPRALAAKSRAICGVVHIRKPWNKVQ